MSKFKMKKTATGYNFSLTAGNGEIIGTSEVYDTSAGCENGIESVKANAPVAEVEDQTLGEEKKNPKFEIYKDKAEEFRFRLTARNGQNILGSEGYSSKEACKNGIESVKKNASEAIIERV